MRRQTLILLCMMCLLCIRPASSSVIVDDPNAPASTVATPTKSSAAVVGLSDERLAQAVTYTAKAEWLHKVISDLSRISGVAIYCGVSEEDWQVRDLPVTVAVHDLPLGKLLRALVFCTHTKLRSTDTDSGTVYRVVEDPNVRKATKDFDEQWQKAQMEKSEWEWDLATRLKDIPFSDIKTPPGENYWDYKVPSAVQVSKILAGLDANTKKRIFAGEPYVTNPRTAPPAFKEAVASLVKIKDGLYMDGVRQINKSMHPVLYRDEEPATASEIENAIVRVFVSGDRYKSIQVSTYIKMEKGLPRSSIPSELRYMPWTDSTETIANIVSRFTSIGKQLPEEPRLPVFPEEVFNTDELRTEKRDSALLRNKVSLPAPKQKPTPADAVVDLAEAAGLSLICEDFHSHGQDRYADNAYGKEAETSSLLESAAEARWFVDERSKLAAGGATDWRDHHESLMPAKVVDWVRDQVNGDGLDLDEIASLTVYTGGQISDWIRGNDFYGMHCPILYDRVYRPFWQFYNSLSAQDKALVHSEAGLPLGRFDPGTVHALFSERVKYVQTYDIPVSGSFENESEEWKKLADPQIAPTLVMQIVSTRSKDYAMQNHVNEGFVWPGEQPSQKPAPKLPTAFLDTTDYKMAITGEKNGQQYSVTILGPTCLPYYSPKRKQVLFDAKTRENAEQAADKAVKAE